LDIHPAGVEGQVKVTGMTSDSRERWMFGFLSRKRKEVQTDKVKKPAERENPATIPGVGEQDLDGLIKRIGISPQGKDNGSIPRSKRHRKDFPFWAPWWRKRGP